MTTAATITLIIFIATQVILWYPLPKNLFRMCKDFVNDRPLEGWPKISLAAYMLADDYPPPTNKHYFSDPVSFVLSVLLSAVAVVLCFIIVSLVHLVVVQFTLAVAGLIALGTITCLLLLGTRGRKRKQKTKNK